MIHYYSSRRDLILGTLTDILNGAKTSSYSLPGVNITTKQHLSVFSVYSLEMGGMISSAEGMSAVADVHELFERHKDDFKEIYGLARKHPDGAKACLELTRQLLDGTVQSEVPLMDGSMYVSITGDKRLVGTALFTDLNISVSGGSEEGKRIADLFLKKFPYIASFADANNVLNPEANTSVRIGDIAALGAVSYENDWAAYSIRAVQNTQRIA